MKGQLPKIVRALLLVACLAAFGAVSAAAQGEPTLATPKTYHYHADLTLNLAGDEASANADGDIDVTRQALHLTVVSQSGASKIRLELILLDKRLYIYNEQRQRWEYTDLPAGENPTVPAGAAPTPAQNIKHPTATYQRVGEETFGGASVEHWRASGPYNVLIPIVNARTIAGTLLQETLTDDVLIGTANRYLYRLQGHEEGTIATFGAGADDVGPVRSDTTYTYSNFDQPVTITAPEGAVPAQSGAPRSLTVGAAGTILERAVALPPDGGAEFAARLLLPTAVSLP